MNDRDEVIDDKTRCEIWTGKRWEVWTVSAAHAHRKETAVRCPECHGPVVLMKGSHNGRNEAHFEHRPSHAGCSLVYKGFSGMRSRHPDAVKTPQTSNQFAFTDYMPDDAAEEIIGPEVDATEKERLMLARVGQGQFRKQLLSRWGTCSVLGCGPDTALIASHIVAWRTCANNMERLDVDNGLLLSPNLDKLFDRGLISFADDGTLLVSGDLDRDDAIALGLRSGMRLRMVRPGILKYLARHREGTNWRDLTV
ncbi:ssDNA-binding Zn-finger/Zn-ribbon topoisomerase 1 [Paraburkholderia atlantica]|uniref:HNH endonuclease n=1 Tax=Paraburkholderia atlantica TaxID=2654982 RepID=UPI003D1C4E2E